MEHRKFLLHTYVKYTGNNRRLVKKNAWGEIVGYVKNIGDQQVGFEAVVEFGDGSFVVPESELDYYHFKDNDAPTVDVVKISRKWDSE